jgi:hypothetical protein
VQNKAGGLTRQAGLAKDMPTLTANIFTATTDRTNTHKRQAVCANGQSIFN